MSRTFNLSRQVNELCDGFNLNPHVVRQITIRPAEIEFEVFVLNEDGKKHVDLKTGFPATETNSFPITVRDAA